MENQLPDWPNWLNLPRVRLMDACALSCGIDPKHLPGDGNVFQEYRHRCDWAKAAVAAYTLTFEVDPKRANYYGTTEGAEVVTLADFRAWGESLASPLTFPTEFPEATTPQDKAPEQVRPAKLRSDREQTLLRVIAAMWALSDLPKAHNPAAGKLSALMDGWGWDGPVESTIADLVLKEAMNLPGAKIRN